MSSVKSFKSFLKSITPWIALYLYRKIRSLPEDFPTIIKFITTRTKTKTTFFERLKLVLKFYQISYSIECPHSEGEMIRVASAILSREPSEKSVLVEAGSYKGGSTAKLSLAARLAGKRLYVFDSFEGIPENQERHGKNIFGGAAYFKKGDYTGSLDEVRATVSKFGDLGVCEFVKGWFENTMPGFKEPIGVAYVDVDLQSSTRTCLKRLYPLVLPGGSIFSQDGHLPLIIELLNDKKFWNNEIGVEKPELKGLGRIKLIEIKK